MCERLIFIHIYDIVYTIYVIHLAIYILYNFTYILYICMCVYVCGGGE